MAQMLYVNANPATQSFGNWLGCGWVERVPASYASVAIPPCVILAGAGQTIIIPDDGHLTPTQIAVALAPIRFAEIAREQAPTAYQPPGFDVNNVGVPIIDGGPPATSTGA